MDMILSAHTNDFSSHHLENNVDSPDPVPATVNLEAVSCDHFTIRGYVAQVLNDDPRKCSPFNIFDVQEPTSDHDDYLPPLAAKKFHRWDCRVCVEKMSGLVDSVISGSDTAKQRGDARGCSVVFIRSTPANSSELKLHSYNHPLSEEKSNEMDQICGSSPNSVIKEKSHPSIDPGKQDQQRFLAKFNTSLRKPKPFQSGKKAKESNNSTLSSPQSSLDKNIVKLGAAKFKGSLKTLRKNDRDTTSRSIIKSKNRKVQSDKRIRKLQTSDRNLVVIQESGDTVNRVSDGLSPVFEDAHLVRDKPRGKQASGRIQECKIRTKDMSVDYASSIPRATLQRKKSRRVRLLSDILSSEVCTYQEPTKVACDRDAESNGDGVARTDNAKLDVVSIDPIGDINLKPAKNKQKYKDLDIVEEGSLKYWLHAAKKLRSERKDMSVKEVCGNIFGGLTRGGEKYVGREIDLNLSQNEVDGDSFATEGNALQTLASCSNAPECENWEPEACNLQKKAPSTEGKWEGNSSKQSKPGQHIESKKQADMNPLQEHARRDQLHQGWCESDGLNDIPNDIPIEIVEINDRTHAHKILPCDKDALGSICNQPRALEFRSCSYIDKQSARTRLHFPQQHKYHLSEAGRAEEHEQVFSHDHPNSANNRIIYVDEYTANVTTFNALSNSGQCASEMPSRCQSHLDRIPLGWDSFKNFSGTPSAVSYNVPFAPHGMPLSNNSDEPSSSLSLGVAPRKWANRENAGIPSFLPAAAESGRFCQPRFAQQRLSGNENMPAMHLLRLLDPSTGSGYTSYQVQRSNCDKALQNSSLDISLQIGGLSTAQNAAVTAPTASKPLRPLPRLGVYGSFLQKEIGGPSQDCLAPSVLRIGESATHDPSQGSRNQSYEISFSRLASAHWSNEIQAYHRRFMQQFPVVSPHAHHSLGSASRKYSRYMDTRKVARLMSKLDSLPICTVNRNPAEITIINDKNKYMTNIGSTGSGSSRQASSHTNEQRTYV